MKGFPSIVAFFVVCSAVLGYTQALTLEVKEGNSTCIKAEFSAVFSITYNTTNDTRTVSVFLPNSTTVDPALSSCGSNGSVQTLMGKFGSGHRFGMNFSTNGSLYSLETLSLHYNLSDASLFPEANSSEVVVFVLSASMGIWAPINTTYRCLSPTTITLDQPNVTFSDMMLEAYMPGNDLSAAERVCAADQTPTVAPTTTTSAATPTTPSPTPAGTPKQGSYSVNNGNGTACLLAKMGVQLNVSYISQSQNKTVQELVNLTPNLTSSSGLCGGSNATLVLTQEETRLSFFFTVNSTSNKYHLSGITLQANWTDMMTPFSASNSSLDYLKSSVGHSYMCNAEQTLFVVTTFSINMFELQVQPFGVTSSQFASAEVCQIDQDQMLIPIIVGAALAGLVLIVLIAYLIGRKRSHAGYQTI
ncbi:hypothetical protein OJAV_G00021560 [Oryzias javanicus]|uniref:Lysosome-associated membrane glycoprotein 1 n=1 Tax=Oryzias javanicus TaxID=123683 RepID=A0A437DI39_ORYJA|nr:hypothetical protein OJAV_G00021560 [Oryzias javanicus]